MPKVVTLSPSQSQISVDTNAIAANGTAACTVSVTVNNTDQSVDDGGDLSPNPMGGLRGSAVVLAVTPSTGVTITQPTGVADANGTVSGSFVSTNAATVTVSATVLGQAVTSGSPSVVVGGGAPPTPPPGDPFFSDDFAGTQRNPADGFTYSTTGSRVSVVSFGGFNAMRFRYGPDATGADSSAEQRFTMGRDLTELWVEYDLYVPSNFVHRTQASGGTNNKFFRVWGDVYASANKVGASTRYDASFSPDNSGLGFEYNYKTWPDGTLGEGPDGFTSGLVEFGDAMKGTWTNVRMHYRMVSATDADDALMELWLGGTKVLTFDNVPQKYDTAKPYWNNGYLMGWANSGYLAETDFHLKALKFYDTDPGWT